jgi:hypothetical protein
MNRRMGMLNVGMWGAGAAVAALALAGCGGGGGNSRTTIHGNLRSGDQTLPDGAYVQGGSYVDVYSCTARDSGSAQVDLKSSDFDSFLIVGTEDSAGVIHTITTSDSGGGGRNAHVDFSVSQDARYFVAATNADGAGRTGSYEMNFSDNLKDINEETNITPAVRAAAARALKAYRAQKTPSVTPPPAP